MSQRLHKLLYLLVIYLDAIFLSNFLLLNRLHAASPTITRLIVSFVKALTGWISGKSWLQRQCADRKSWNNRKGRVTQSISFHLRLSSSLHVNLTSNKFE